MTIDSYRFGEIVIKGKKYTSDVIVFPDRVQSSWWRREGHQLCLEDIEEIFLERPEVLVVGKGDSGLMEVLPETRRWLGSRGIRLVAENSEKACRTYNQLCTAKKVVAAIHLTC